MINKVNKKIVLISTGQPSTNPRMVKEANALHAAGFIVTVLYCFFIEWAQTADKKLLNKVQWEYQMIGGSPQSNKTIYFLTRLRFKIANLLNRYVGNSLLFAERAQARCYDELIKTAKTLKADWYIGHNLGALSVAVKAAQFNHAKAGFDFEDYHRGENLNTTSYNYNRIVYLEKKYLLSLDYLSAASPLIKEKINHNFPLLNTEIITILNCFSLVQQPGFREKKGDKILHLFWFSQTISSQRGLETIIESLRLLNNPDIHLTLAGRLSDNFKAYIENIEDKIKKQIHMAGIIPPDDLPSFASQFDIGLAVELDMPQNRDVCLTNKIFTYLLAGNAIILSETAMQKKFNDEFHIGESFIVEDSVTLSKQIQAYFNKDKLEKQRARNYKLALEIFNWENESRKFLNKL